jgi:hypothetical protein
MCGVAVRVTVTAFPSAADGRPSEDRVRCHVGHANEERVANRRLAYSQLMPQMSFVAADVTCNIRVNAYEFPHITEGPDAGWVSGEVELLAGVNGMFSSSVPVTFRAEELEAFHWALSQLERGAVREACLAHLEEQVWVRVFSEQDTLKVQASVRDGGNCLTSTSADMHPLAFAAAMNELETVIRSFPARA